MSVSDLSDLDVGLFIRGGVAEQKLFERYTLKRVLGRGGMGIVWLAFDEDLKRNVAMKFLPDMLMRDLQAVDDLKRETRRSLDLTHHHIVRIYDFTQDAACAAIIMEYVDGETLSTMKALQAGGCFDVGTIAVWVGHFCQALDYAHRQARIVHRDLKPANLMVNGRGDLKITDFGISRSMSDSMTRVSVSNSAGTLAYMSPEQALGAPPAVSDDVYAFGATVYDLITGRPPFYRGNLPMQLETVVPPRMSERRLELGTSAGEIPDIWEEVIARCLAKSAADRPENLAEIAMLLGVGGPTSGPRPLSASAKHSAASGGPATDATRQGPPATTRTHVALAPPEKVITEAQTGIVPAAQPPSASGSLRATTMADALPGYNFEARRLAAVEAASAVRPAEPPSPEIELPIVPNDAQVDSAPDVKTSDQESLLEAEAVIESIKPEEPTLLDPVAPISAAESVEEVQRPRAAAKIPYAPALPTAGDVGTSADKTELRQSAAVSHAASVPFPSAPALPVSRSPARTQANRGPLFGILAVGVLMVGVAVFLALSDGDSSRPQVAARTTIGESTDLAQTEPAPASAPDASSAMTPPSSIRSVDAQQNPSIATQPSAPVSETKVEAPAPSVADRDAQDAARKVMEERAADLSERLSRIDAAIAARQWQLGRQLLGEIEPSNAEAQQRFGRIQQGEADDAAKRNMAPPVNVAPIQPVVAATSPEPVERPASAPKGTAKTGSSGQKKGRNTVQQGAGRSGGDSRTVHRQQMAPPAPDPAPKPADQETKRSGMDSRYRFRVHSGIPGS